MSVAICASFRAIASYSSQFPSHEMSAEPKPYEMSAEPKAHEMYLQIIYLLEQIVNKTTHSADKLTNLELRQCLTDGEGTDASRFVHTWARAQSASISEKH
eukprot:15406562-Heterocapsa_arctica.AAC.1